MKVVQFFLVQRIVMVSSQYDYAVGPMLHILLISLFRV